MEDDSSEKSEIAPTKRKDASAKGKTGQKKSKRKKTTESTKEKTPLESSEDCEHDANVFDKLPDEMLIKVMSYLGHGDKLCARQVNKRWCNVLSVWPGFCNSAVYLLKHGMESGITLTESTYKWKKLRIEKYRLTSKETLDLPTNILANVITAELTKCIFVWPVVKELIASFPAAEEVSLLQCKRLRTKKKPSVSNNRIVARVIPDDEWSASVGKIKSIHLVSRRVSDLIIYLQEFKSCNLVSFRVIELLDGVEFATPEAAIELIDLLYELLYNSRKNLKSLSFKLASNCIMMLFYPRLIHRLCDVGLNLQSLEVDILSPESVASRDIKILGNFLRTQPNLMKIYLPSFGVGSVEELQRLVMDVPKTVRYLHAPHYNQFAPNFLDMFPHLHSLEVHSDIRSHLQNKMYPRITTLEAKQDIRCESIPDIVKAFPFLVELNLNGFCHDLPMLDDRSLQTICIMLKSLRSLILGGCSRITDFGVTGIRKEYCQRLYRSRSLCLYPEQAVPDYEVLGVKLSSLKGLKRLEINGPTNITDVGIYYGFGFQELRYLRLQENFDVTDWGYDHIAKLNPDLEELIVGYGQSVTHLGLTSMKNQLRRIQPRNLLLLSILREYVSSDESYAMESDSDVEGIVVLIPHLPNH